MWRFDFRRVVATLLAVAAAVSLAACRRAIPPEPPPIIMIVADALRHDYPDLPGYRPDPRGMARLGSTATVFEKCVTTMPMTRGSFPGLLSGQMTGTLDDAAQRSSWIARLRAAGYRTAFISSSYAFGKEPSSVDIAAMFDEVFLEQKPGRAARPMPEAIDLLDQVLARRKNDRIVVILHLFYPHAPYWRLSYGENVTELDHQIARVLDVLARRGLYDRTHIIMTSDHGESLQEHDSPPQHGWTVYGEETRIPLLWKVPGQHERRIVGDLVRNFDIGPTLVASILGDDHHRSSRSGRPIWAIAGGSPDTVVAFHTALASRMYPVPQIAIRTNRYLMVQSSEGLPSTELYDYDKDPGELYNIASSDAGRQVIRDLAPRLAELKRTWINTELEKRENLSFEMRKTLESLGYLGTGPSRSQPASPLEAQPVTGVRVRFRECFSQPWSRYAGDTYDSLFPIRLIVAGDDLYLISNSTRDLSRLYSKAGRVRPLQPHGPTYSEVWFERRNYELTAKDGTLLALLDGRKLKKYYVNPDDYRLDEEGQTFGQSVATLDRVYNDLFDAPGLGLLLFTKDAIYLRRDNGRTELLGRYSSDAYRAAVDAPAGVVYVADGQRIVRLRPGRPAEVFKDVGARILSVTLRGHELWVGTDAFPSTATNKEPIVIYDTNSGQQMGSFGSRLLRDASKNFWSAVDVGPFGVAFPRQIVFNGGRLYILDSGLERILTFDVF
jgi:hypothetical protein